MSKVLTSDRAVYLLEEVATVNPKRPRMKVNETKLVYFLPMSSIGEGLSGIYQPKFRPFKSVSKGYTYFEEGDILFAKITPCLENGKHTLVKYLPDGYGFGTTELHVIRASDKLDSRYLFYVLTKENNIRRCIRHFSGTAGQQRIQPDILKSIRIHLPPIIKQRKIATILDGFQHNIERTKNVIDKTEQLRDALLHELLTRGIPGRHTEWREIPGLGTIPAAWQVVCLGDVCAKPSYGAALAAQPYDPELPRYIRITDLTEDGQLHGSDPRSVDPVLAKGYELAIGDLLFARSGSVGLTYMYKPEDGRCIYAGYLIKFRPNPEIVLTEFIELWTRSQPYKKWVSSVARVGAQPNINAKEYSSMPIPLPSLDEQSKIIASIQAINRYILTINNTRFSLITLKSALSHGLLNGQIKARVHE